MVLPFPVSRQLFASLLKPYVWALQSVDPNFIFLLYVIFLNQSVSFYALCLSVIYYYCYCYNKIVIQSDSLETSPIWKAPYFISPETIKHRRALAKLVGRISNFRHVLNVVFLLVHNSPTSEFYVPTFRNSSIFIDGVSIHPAYTAYEGGTDKVFRNVGTWNSNAGEPPTSKNTTCWKKPSIF